MFTYRVCALMGAWMLDFVYLHYSGNICVHLTLTVDTINVAAYSGSD